MFESITTRSNDFWSSLCCPQRQSALSLVSVALGWRTTLSDSSINKRTSWPWSDPTSGQLTTTLTGRVAACRDKVLPTKEDRAWGYVALGEVVRRFYVFVSFFCRVQARGYRIIDRSRFIINGVSVLQTYCGKETALNGNGKKMASNINSMNLSNFIISVFCP